MVKKKEGRRMRKTKEEIERIRTWLDNEYPEEEEKPEGGEIHET